MKNLLTVSDIRDLISDGPREYAGLASNTRAIAQLLDEAEQAEANVWHDERAEEAIAKMEKEYGDNDLPF